MNKKNEPKEHSWEWFQKHQQECREEIAKWPKWMRDTMYWAAATFPVVGDSKPKDKP